MKTVVLTLISFIAIYAEASGQSDSADYFFKRGQSEKAAGRTLVAYQNFQKALRFSPRNADYLKQAGTTAAELRKYEFARQHFEQAYQLDKNDTSAIIQLAQLNFTLRQWNEAIKYADLMRQKQLGNRFNYILGKSNYEEENYGESYKYFQAAAKEEPKNAEIPYLIGRSFVEMSNYKTAVQFFDQALAIDTTKANWFYETGMTYYAIPDAKKALVYFERALKKGYKASSDVVENLSNAYIDAGQPQKGAELLKQLLEKRPGDLELLRSLGYTHFKMAKYNEAIGYYDKLLYFDKADAKALYMIGLSYQKKGEKSKGEQLCDKAIEMDPSLRSYRTKKEIPSGL